MYPHVSGNEGPWETKQPESFADLAYCYNLQWLGLPNGIEIPSLEPLSGLTQLEVIELDGTNDKFGGTVIVLWRGFIFFGKVAKAKMAETILL